MAELLIKATEPWNNDLSASQMTEEERIHHDSRIRKGDIVVVRPDGWKWGRKECLPNFIVVKVKETYEEAKRYEEPLAEEREVDGGMESVTLRSRKYHIDALSVDSISAEVRDFKDITAVDLKTEIREKSDAESEKSYR